MTSEDRHLNLRNSFKTRKAPCGKCDKLIGWARTPLGKWHMVEIKPVKGGNVFFIAQRMFISTLAPLMGLDTFTLHVCEPRS